MKKSVTLHRDIAYCDITALNTKYEKPYPFYKVTLDALMNHAKRPNEIFLCQEGDMRSRNFYKYKVWHSSPEEKAAYHQTNPKGTATHKPFLSLIARMCPMAKYKVIERHVYLYSMENGERKPARIGRGEDAIWIPDVGIYLQFDETQWAVQMLTGDWRNPYEHKL